MILSYFLTSTTPGSLSLLEYLGRSSIVHVCPSMQEIVLHSVARY